MAGHREVTTDGDEPAPLDAEFIDPRTEQLIGHNVLAMARS